MTILAWSVPTWGWMLSPEGSLVHRGSGNDGCRDWGWSDLKDGKSEPDGSGGGGREGRGNQAKETALQTSRGSIPSRMKPAWGPREASGTVSEPWVRAKGQGCPGGLGGGIDLKHSAISSDCRPTKTCKALCTGNSPALPSFFLQMVS